MYEPFLRYPFMSAAGLSQAGAEAFVDAMCRIELALTQAIEDTGRLPAGTADAIGRYVFPAAFDIEALAGDVADGGNVAIAFVKHAKALLPSELRAGFHRGATSQDVLDSALMLVLKPRLDRCLALLGQCRGHGCALMQTHENTPMIGRTLMQQALPMTFGAKLAHWLWGLLQAERRLFEIYRGGLYVQFGGPVGVHSDLADDGITVMDALAKALGLASPVVPWHTNRQPILGVVDALDAAAIAAEKIALDVGLLAQTEIGELSEPAETGAGGSSSMPHKRNPVGCARIRAAARQIHAAVALIHNAGAQPLERGLGEWHAEWAPLMDAALLLEGALETLASLLGGLNVHTEAMRANLAATGAAIMAAPARALLEQALPRDRAAALAREASGIARREHRDYAEVLLAYPEINAAFDAEAVRAAADPARHVGTSAAQIARLRRCMEAIEANQSTASPD